MNIFALTEANFHGLRQAKASHRSWWSGTRPGWTRVGGFAHFGYCPGMQTVPTRSVALALFGALLFAGCTNEGNPKPVISTFTCFPQTLPGGPGNVTFTWAVSGAISLDIEPLVGAVSPVNNGSATVQVTATATFTLTATGLNGTTTATCPVTVTQQPVINSLTATPSTLSYGGGPVSLAWNVTGATMLSIDQGVGTVSPDTIGSVTELVTMTTIFTLTACNSAGCVTASVTVTVLPKVTDTVNGTVVDINGQPAAGQTVLITSGTTFSQMVTTDVNGAFSVSNVPPTYNATIIQTSIATEYVGLTRADPTLTAFFFVSSNRMAGLSGTITGGTFPEPPGYSTTLIFDSPQIVHGLGDPTSGSYSATIKWPGASTTTGTLYALQVHTDGGVPADYPGFGMLSGVTLTDTSSLGGQNVALNAVTSGALSGSATAPPGYSILYKSIDLQVASNLSLNVLFDPTANGTFGYVTPAVSNTTLTVTAAASSALGEFSAVIKAGQSANASGLTFAIPAAPVLTAPPDAGTGVTLTTPFTWTTYPGAVYEFQTRSSGGLTFYILTASTTATLPDLSAYGFPIPSTTDFSWFVVALAPVASVDLLAAPGGFNSVTIDLNEGVSAMQSFVTGP
jgi:hypothetical protein